MKARDLKTLPYIALFAIVSFFQSCATTQQQLNAIIADVQSFATSPVGQAVCKGFIPAASTIIAYYNAAAGASAAAIGTAICNVVAQIPPINPAVSAKLKASPPFVNVNGNLIVIHGYWRSGPNTGQTL